MDAETQLSVRWIEQAGSFMESYYGNHHSMTCLPKPLKGLMALLLLSAVPALSQTPKASAPEQKSIDGIVIDNTGSPVFEASIDHSGAGFGGITTDREGRFHLETRSPVLVIRKAGYRSFVLRTDEPVPGRVTLQPLESHRLSTCSSKRRCYTIEGWTAHLCFAKHPGLKASRQARDVDYAARSYFLDENDRTKQILHGAGPQWSYGLPSDDFVWSSVQYREDVKTTRRGLPVIDARGQAPDGKRWRFLGKFGESASYHGVDENAAEALDPILDAVCELP